MSFAQRVISFLDERQQQQAPAEMGRPDHLHDTPEVLASRLLQLQERPDQSMIGKPRASSIYKACMRMHVLGTVLKKRRSARRLGSGDKVIFSIGDALHYWAQNTPTYFGDARVGFWRCRACSRQVFGMTPKSKCVCGARAEAFVYREHSLDLGGNLPVTGHPDMLLSRRPGVYRLVELKSINGEDFLNLKAPYVDHEYQVVTYLWGLANDPALPIAVKSDYGYILYVSKRKVVKGFPVKAFVVKQNIVILEAVHQKLFAYSEWVKYYPRQLPSGDETCFSSKFTNWTARECPVMEDCRRHSDE
jgi:hypothetical protein